MNCLIIAAGLGSRLRAISESKPLALVGGVPLIEHVVAAAARAGATAFTVVTGHEAERVEAFLEALAGRLGIGIRSARTADWRRPNGFSVLTGAACIEGDYLLAMSDHLFDPAIAERLLRSGGPAAGVTLAVDRDLANPLTDMGDATKVETGEGGAIVSIGKALIRFDAIDTGLFLATPELAAAISAAIAQGGAGSLSEGVQRLADAGRARTMDIESRWWIDVDDPRDFRRAEQALAAGAASGGSAA